MTDTPEHLWSMRRLGSGDYLLPSNDLRHVFRIIASTEGPSSGIDEWRTDRRVWSVRLWTGPRLGVDPDAWHHWQEIKGLIPRRADAVDAALRWSAERGDA